LSRELISGDVIHDESNHMFNHFINIMEGPIMESHGIQLLMRAGQKFIRRADLTPFIRLHIAFTVLLARQTRQWGTVTQLARQYLISRTFVYMLAVTLEQTSQIVFGEQFSPAPVVTVVNEAYLPYRYMVSLRLEGRCSLGAISTIMKRFAVENSSVGKISQTLQAIGALLPKTLCTHAGESQMVVFLSDELFAKGRPILVTAEPQSSALLCVELSDTRQWEDWQQHWECLEDNGYHAIYLVCDGGHALNKAQKEALKDIFRQPDTYHAIAHRLGGFVKRLEREGYTAIDHEDSWHKKLRLAGTAAARKTCRQKYTNAQKKAAKKIDRYEDYAYLYRCLVEELRLFDDTGQLRDRQTAEGNMAAALELLDTLGVGYISDAVQKVRRELPDVLTYFDVAQAVVAQLETLPLEQKTLHSLCRAWQWQKHQIKAKTSKARQYCAAREQGSLEVAAASLHEDEEYEDLKEQVYRMLDQIVQSSSLVECLNSIIRPYLNTSRNHVTQELLNLVMFYHNHRRYTDGKRRGKTPMELLTGKPQEKDWLDLLFEVIEEKQPGFFAVSR
jgi:hypothetical protein